MIRRLILKGLPAVAAVLLLTTPALAGGVVVTLDTDPARVDAGNPFTVGFTVISMHTGQPESDLQPQVTATNAATGEVVKVIANQEDAPGHFVATLTLPSAGEWNWEIQPYGNTVDNYPPSVFTSILVKAPVAVAAPTAVASPAQQAAMPWLAFGTIGALAALVALVWAASRMGRRAEA